MKTSGIGGATGIVYGSAEQSRSEKQESTGSFEPAAEKKIYVRRPAAAVVGQVSVLDVFNRMSENGNGINRAMARLEGSGVSVWSEKEKGALESVWQEYEQQLPEDEREGAIKKTETESEIVVKPDGSKVLVITVKTGGVVTSVMTMKISEPTHEADDSGQEGASEAPQEGETSEGDPYSELPGMALED